MSSRALCTDLHLEVNENCQEQSHTTATANDINLLSYENTLHGANDFNVDSGGDLCEDIHSRLFVDLDDERYLNMSWDDVMETDDSTLRPPISEEGHDARAQNHQNGGLPNWEYDSLFTAVEVKIDDVDTKLGTKFVEETNTVLENVIEDIESLRNSNRLSQSAPTHMTSLKFLQAFITDCLLEKLVCFTNRLLHYRGKASTTRLELHGDVILHVLCALYNESPTTVCDPSERDSFFQMGITSERYHDVWSALSGCKEKRALHDYSATGWCL